MSPAPLYLPRVLSVLVAAALLAPVGRATLWAQEGVFLTDEQAPAAVFPDANAFGREVVTVTPDIRDRMRQLLAGMQPSVWEEQYVTFKAMRGDTLLGHAVIVDEIGKHRTITFIVGVRPDGKVSDVAVMAYREAYGGEVKSQRFLAQFRGKSAGDGLQPYADIKNIAGATLSVEAASRAVKKALAFARVAFGAGAQS